MNLQKPEPLAKGDGESLDLHSMFFTIQGEGPFTGHRSVFIRLAGCNIACPGCDTEYTQGRQTMPARHIALEASMLARQNDAAGCLVVITGGEPLRQSIGKLVEELRSRDHAVQIESNGILAPDARLHALLNLSNGRDLCLVISPKTTRVSPVSAALASAFKYVLDEDSVAEDGLPIKALGHPAATGVARPPMSFTGPIYLNPFDAGDPERNQRNLVLCAQSAKKHGYVLGVQLHKLVGLE